MKYNSLAKSLSKSCLLYGYGHIGSYNNFNARTSLSVNILSLVTTLCMMLFDTVFTWDINPITCNNSWRRIDDLNCNRFSLEITIRALSILFVQCLIVIAGVRESRFNAALEPERIIKFASFFFFTSFIRIGNLMLLILSEAFNINFLSPKRVSPSI